MKNPVTDEYIEQILDAVKKSAQADLPCADPCPGSGAISEYISLLNEKASVETLLGHPVSRHVGRCNKCFRHVNEMHLQYLLERLKEQQKAGQFAARLMLSIRRAITESRIGKVDPIKGGNSPSWIPFKTGEMAAGLSWGPESLSAGNAHILVGDWSLEVEMKVNANLASLSISLSSLTDAPEGAVIRIMSSNGDVIAEKQVASGKMEFPNLKPGEYAIEIERVQA